MKLTIEHKREEVNTVKMPWHLAGTKVRIFAAAGLIFFGVSYFYIQGVTTFAKKIVFRQAPYILKIDYPRITGVVAVIDQPSSVVYRSMLNGKTSLWLYVADLDASDVTLEPGAREGNLWLYIDCGAIEKRILREAQKLLKTSPLDERAFNALPLTHVQRLAMKLWIVQEPLLVIAAPRSHSYSSPTNIYLRMCPLLVMRWHANESTKQ